MFNLKCLFTLLTTKYSILITAFYILHSTFCISSATTRFVSHTGSSTPPYTSWDTAADSIQKAIDICEPGDTVLVANGIYKENLVINTEIALIGLSMDSTVIDGRGLGDFTITFNASGIIENFNIYGKGEGTSGTRVIWAVVQFTFIKIKNCQISAAGGGISCISSSLEAENLSINKVLIGVSLFSGNEASFSLSNCNIIISQPDSRGINIGFASEASVYLTNNIILFTGTPQVNYGISIGAPKKVYIENNLISGFGCNIYMDVVVDTAYVRNNILAYNTVAWPLGSIQSDGNDVLVNNIILQKNRVGIDGDSRLKADYNLYWLNNIDLTGLNYGDSDRVADPMFIKDTLPNAALNFDYHLQAYSPAIDAGNPDILDVDGSRSDIGLYGGPFGQSYKYKDLPPRTPVNFIAIVDSNEIKLQWNRNSEADTSHYNVYRDTVINFTIDSTKLIASVTDVIYTEPIPGNASKYVYKITCVDNQGNESGPSVERVINTVSAGEYPVIIDDYTLYQNYPNPFNPSTTIGYKLIGRAYVKLMVYDIKGELVSVLVNKEQEAGYYEVEFNLKSQISNFKSGLASGIYLYRIEVIGDGNLPVYSDMKKMVLIK